MSKGTEKRRRAKIIRIRVDEKEEAAIKELADKRGISPPALLRQTLLNVPPGPGVRRPSVNNKALAAYLAATAKITDALKANKAEMGKSGSNLNQIAYMLNTGAAPDRIINIVESAIEEHRALVAKHDRALDEDLIELRTMAMEVWGLDN